MRGFIAKQLIRVVMRLLYTKHERNVLHASVAIVSGNPTIPSFAIQLKRGREYRRDEASFQALSGTGMSQRRVNLGTELAYFLLKPYQPEQPRKHHQRIGNE